MEGLEKVRLKFGACNWDSWGFSICYCPYDKSISINFIHWVAYVELWTAKEVKRHDENLIKLKKLMECGDLDD